MVEPRQRRCCRSVARRAGSSRDIGSFALPVHATPTPPPKQKRRPRHSDQIHSAKAQDSNIRVKPRGWGKRRVHRGKMSAPSFVCLVKIVIVSFKYVERSKVQLHVTIIFVAAITPAHAHPIPLAPPQLTQTPTQAHMHHRPKASASAPASPIRPPPRPLNPCVPPKLTLHDTAHSQHKSLNRSISLRRTFTHRPTDAQPNT